MTPSSPPTLESHPANRLVEDPAAERVNYAGAPMGVPADPSLATAGLPTAEEDSGIDVLRIVAIFVAEWRVGLITAVLAFAVGAAYVFHLPSRYVADTVILPKDAPTAGSGGLSAIFATFRPASPYLTLLTSRGLMDDVIRRANLSSVFHTMSMEGARGTLSGMTQIIPGGDGTYNIRVKDQNAVEAARIANTYVDALRALQESMAMQQAETQRRFFEQQLQREKNALAAAEQDLERTQEGSGVVEMGTQTQIGLSAIANTRAQITSLEVRLAALLQSETEQNPEVRTLRSQIGQLEAQERTQESQAGSGGAVGAAAPAGRMPQVNLEYTRKQREVRYHEALVSSLANHFEDLRLGEGSMGDSFDVIDQAVVPENPTWPPRRLYLLLVAAASVLLGCVAIAIAVAVHRILNDQQQRENLRLIAASVRGRR